MLPNGPAASHAKRNGFQVLMQISANPRKYIYNNASLFRKESMRYPVKNIILRPIKFVTFLGGKLVYFVPNFINIWWN